MDLDITEFFNTANAFDYSASQAELGENAGKITWNAACHADYNILDTEEKRDAFRKFVKESGGWNDAEIAAWSDNELNALCIQWISGDMRETGLDTCEPDWQAYQAECEEGNCAGRIYGGSMCVEGHQDKVYFSLD